jgi:hypothetical protein
MPAQALKSGDSAVCPAKAALVSQFPRRELCGHLCVLAGCRLSRVLRMLIDRPHNGKVRPLQNSDRSCEHRQSSAAALAVPGSGTKQAFKKWREYPLFRNTKPSSRQTWPEWLVMQHDPA